MTDVTDRLQGAELREWYERRGWTQTEAAERLGVAQPRLSEMVRGVAPIREQTRKLIAALDRIEELERERNPARAARERRALNSQR